MKRIYIRTQQPRRNRDSRFGQIIFNREDFQLATEVIERRHHERQRWHARQTTKRLKGVIVLCGALMTMLNAISSGGIKTLNQRAA